MGWLEACGLATLHALHFIWTCLTALLYYPFLANPQPLEAHRSKLPKNLALVLSSTHEKASEEETEAVIQSVICAVRWSKKVGIRGLSVYDRHGCVSRCSNQIKAALPYDTEHVPLDSEYSSDGSDSEYPPTPPLTDFTDSRPISPENWCSPPSVITMKLESNTPRVRRSSFRQRQVSKTSQLSQENDRSKPMTLSLVSYEASKPLMAAIARTFAASWKKDIGSRSADYSINIKSVDDAVQESLDLPPPDLMIVHSIEQHSLSSPPLELYGFPPWLLRLTEIYYDDRPSLSRAWHNRGNKRNFVPLSEENFRRALDSYTYAEMRLGK